MQALTYCDAKFMSTRTAAGQFKCQFKGAMDMKCRRRFEMQTLTFCDANITSTRTAAGQFKGQFKGAMDASSGRVQDASTQY
jgi:multimeric flavodoxin WrbA